MSAIGIREATLADAGRMAELAELKRAQYRHYAPVFHRPKPGARDQHAAFLASQIESPERIAIVHDPDGVHLDGFLVAALVPAPPVYDPGGLTCLIDDFMVESAGLWASIGRLLLEGAIERSAPRGAVQTVVVCGPHDEPKRSMLLDAGQVVVSEWFTKSFGSALG